MLAIKNSFGFLALSVMLGVSGKAAQTLPASQFDQQLISIRLEHSIYAEQSSDNSAKAASSAPVARFKHRSPGKAFLYSLIVPGLGQYYNGSKVKAAGFFLFDVTAWAMNFKYRADGNDLTDKFVKFQQTHWQIAGYRKYLYLCYGDSSDANITAQEVSHHLPDSPTQQYYEMTGKYDQFSWGWDDATYLNRSIDTYGITDTMPRITDHQYAPISANRNQYETMRYVANHKFDVADRWVIVALANHLISAFEAMLTARRKNAHGGEPEFGRINVKADMRSFNAYRDTPYLRMSYAF